MTWSGGDSISASLSALFPPVFICPGDVGEGSTTEKSEGSMGLPCHSSPLPWLQGISLQPREEEQQAGKGKGARPVVVPEEGEGAAAPISYLGSAMKLAAMSLRLTFRGLNTAPTER